MQEQLRSMNVKGRERRSVYVLLVVVLSLAAATVMMSCQGESKSGSAASLEPVTDSVASSDGVMIHYDVAGQGDTALVFVHCWSGDRTYWSEMMKRFAGDYRVVAMDLGGHGESGLGRDDWTIPAFGADVAAVVEKLDLQPVILVGHSMGGAVSIEAARLMPERVTALVGVDTDQDLTAHPTDAQIAQFLSPFKQDFAGTTKEFARMLFLPDADSSLVQRISDDMAAAPPAVAISSIENLFHYDAASALNDMRKPIRAINADRFPTNVEGNRQVAESFDVKYMPGHGHFPQLEDPDTFEKLLRETIAEFWPMHNTESQNH